MTPKESPRVRATSVPHVVLHVGTMKSGTSYLQDVMRRNTDALARAGVTYANALAGSARAVNDAIGDDGVDPLQRGLWKQFARRMRTTSTPITILSSEFLSFVDKDVATEIVAALRPARVTIVVTARDLARVIPSAWQNKVKHGRGWSFEGFLRSIMSPRDDAAPGAQRSFWHHHDLPRIIRTWIPAVGPANVTLIPVPPLGARHDELWERLARVLDVDADAFDSAPTQQANASLGLAETEILRRVNRQTRDVIDKATHKRLVQRYLANEVLRPDPTRTPPPEGARLPADAHAWAIATSIQFRNDIQTLGIRIIGSADDLVPRPAGCPDERGALPEPGVHTTGADRPDDLTQAVVSAIVTLLLRIDELETGARTPHSSRPSSVAARRDHDQIERAAPRPATTSRAPRREVTSR